jgi:hypothetical protein
LGKELLNLGARRRYVTRHAASSRLSALACLIRSHCNEPNLACDGRERVGLANPGPN